MKYAARSLPASLGVGEARLVRRQHMPELRFTKGDMVASAFVNALEDGRYRGLVLLSRDGGGSDDAQVYRAEPTLDSESEALEQAGALAQHLLKRYEN